MKRLLLVLLVVFLSVAPTQATGTVVVTTLDVGCGLTRYAIACAPPVINAAYDFQKMRRAFYNNPQISPDGLRVVDAMATEWLNKKRAEQEAGKR